MARKNRNEKVEVDAEVEEKEAPAAEGRMFTYVGHGEEPPRKIHFMGKQHFVRGQVTEVTDPEVLTKLEGHKCFVEGEVDQETLFSQDEIAAQKAERQRVEDRRTTAAVKKQQAALAHHGDGKDE